MKIKVDIFTGFLGSGKTSLINEMLLSSLFQKEKILVIQCEAGKEGICPDLLSEGRVRVEKLAQGAGLTAKMVREMMLKFFPDRVIIEQNGMAGLHNLISELNQAELRKLSYVNSIMHTADARSWETLMHNMGSKLLEQAAGSELIIFNFSAGLSQDKSKALKRKIHAINPSAEILYLTSPREFRRELDEGTVYFEEKPVRFGKRTWPHKFCYLFFLGVLGYLLFSILPFYPLLFPNANMERIQSLNTMFVSILMQAFPFLLIGAFISSLIQVFVSNDALTRFFSKNKAFSFFMALAAGVFLPVCDCAIIPVVFRLIKKGVPLGAALTFLLAAPTVNPIVVASTYYAFPDQPLVVFTRLILGCTIALLVGIAFSFYPRQEKILLDQIDMEQCTCAYCREGSAQDRSLLKKIAVIFQHTGAEFIDVGRFLIMGAFLTGLVQTFIPREALFQLAGAKGSSLAAMMGSAFIFSVCSTSDAFIARSFSAAFPIDAVMGFLVLGPMLDLKNFLVLLGNFRKGFVLRLVFFIFMVTYFLLYYFTSVIFAG
ncbi:MAG: permease [Dehalobacterium sp.]